MLSTRESKVSLLLPTKVRLVKAMVSPVVMDGCESWTVKKAEHWRIDAFELWCWRRILRVPWTARRSKQSILKAISPGISLEVMMQPLNFLGLRIYFKFKIFFNTCTKALGQRFDIFSSPWSRFVVCINHCCPSKGVPASEILLSTSHLSLWIHNNSC